MDLLDVGIICLLIALASRGYASGFFRQAGSLGGFTAGLILGSAVVPSLLKLISGNTAQPLLGIVLVFGIASAVSGVGELLGITAARGVERAKLGAADQGGGAGLGVVIGLFLVWLLSSMFMRVPVVSLQNEIRDSYIIRTLDAHLPPAPEALSRFERIIAPDGFPRVFTGLEPSPAPPVTGPNAEAINAAAAAGRESTVQIVGAGCGGEVDGSGFVAAPGLVITNAHVVAGIETPFVIDQAGRHRATVVGFDPDLDIAVLRTSGLAGAPLTLSPDNAERGTVGAALGYPGGGPFTVSPAAVLSRQTAVGRNIYDRGLVRRDIYELQAQIRPGDSGGPVVLPDGTVIGVVFATSTTNDQVGYALTSKEVIPELKQAAGAAPTGTGACAEE